MLLTRRRPMGFSVAILLLALLLLAGDVEENPGPPKRTRKCSKVAIDSKLLSLTQACSYVLSGSQASLLSERVFKEFFSRVSDAIQGCLDKFAGKLLSENVIDWEVIDNLSGTLGLTPTQKSQIVLRAVRSKIVSTKKDKPLRSLCCVMDDFSVLKDLAKEMMERFGKWPPC